MPATDSNLMSFRAELAIAIECAREAGGILLRHRPGTVDSWDKSEGDPVTAADLEADEAIRARLSAVFPEDALLTEESADDPMRLGRERCWIVDPIDGTREFIAGIPEFAISIGLVVRGEPVVGVVFNPAVDVLYSGYRGGGCFRNGVRVGVSGCTELSRARACVSRSEIETERMAPYLDWFSSLEAVGSIAWKLALVSGGEMDFNLSMRGKHEWDVCAGDLLVREAGGRYLDLEGAPRRYNQPDPDDTSPRLAGTQPLWAEFVERLER